MADLTYVRARYLDTSSAIKLVVTEEGSDALRAYVHGGGPFYITSVCVPEALSVLKVKHFYRKELTATQYSLASYGLLTHLRDGIHVVNVDLTPSCFFEVETLAKQYKLDLIDALQIYTLKHGRFSKLAGPSKSLLLTADISLGKAASAEGFDVWNCVRDPMPTVG